MPLTNPRLLTRMRRTRERLQTMRIPTIDSWQQSHTVCCVTPLVNALTGMAWISNDADEVRIHPESIHEAISCATICARCEGEGEVPNPDGDDGDIDPCEECGGRGQCGEVMEFWVVDSYLGEQLRLQGESLFSADCIGIVGDLVWCRTTSGQLIIADSCVEAAYAQHCKALATI